MKPKKRKNNMIKNQIDSTIQKINGNQQDVSNEHQPKVNKQQQIYDLTHSTDHQLVYNDSMNDRSQNTNDKQIVQDEQSNNQLNVVRSNEQAIDTEHIANQSKEHQSDVDNDLERNEDIINKSVDETNGNVHDKPIDNTNIQIDTSIKSHSLSLNPIDQELDQTVHDSQSVETKEKEEVESKKLLSTDSLEQLNGKQTNGTNIDDSYQHKQNSTDQQQSPTSQETVVHKKMPDLLLTENNRPGNGNKLLIVAILLFKFVTYFIIKIIGLFHPAKRGQLPPINEPLLLLSASEIVERVKKGELKCEHVIRAYVNRIQSVQPKLNAVVDDCFEDAINRAREIDEQMKDPKLAVELKKLPLLGCPFTCKNSISIKGLAHNAGVVIHKDRKAERDATIVSNLRQAGAIPLCITNTPELVLWYDSDNNLYGKTNNPYDLSRIAGGSSGGEGSLIASAGSLIGLGSDVAGSIRIPSMFCGIFGHKTIQKYVPVDGTFPAPPKTYDTFLCYGPICRYAKDLPLALREMCGSLTDELKLDEPVDFSKIKIYYMDHDGGMPFSSFVDQRILNSMHKVIKYFQEEYGMEAEQINIKKFKYALAFFGTVSVKGEFKIEDYVSRTGKVNVYWELLKSFFGKSDITRPILIQIVNQTSPYCDVNSTSYKRFTKMLEELKPKVHEMLGDNAVLIMPTWPVVAPKHKTTILRGFDASYTVVMNALELPATHCTVGLTKEEKLPHGFTVAAAPGSDRISIAFAKEIERVWKGWVELTRD